MKTITYNPETHVLVPREPNPNWCAGCSPDNCSGCGAEQVDGKTVDYLLDGARFKLSFQEIECNECGTEYPYVLVTPLDQYANELNGKWVALVPAENDRHLRMTPPPYRTAELEAALKVARDALDHARLFIRNGIGLGYIRMPDDDCPDPAKSVPGEIFEALAKINEVIHD